MSDAAKPDEYKMFTAFEGVEVYAPDSKPYQRRAIRLGFGEAFRGGTFQIYLTPENARAIAAALIEKADHIDRIMPAPSPEPAVEVEPTYPAPEIEPAAPEVVDEMPF